MTDEQAPTWQGDLGAFIEACVSRPDLAEFRAALASMPADQWPAVRAALATRLSEPSADEPTALQRQVGVGLAARMTTPLGLLRRQIRLEKLRILSELTSADRSGA